MKEYLDIFIDKEYPDFIDKYLETKTLNRLKYITQFCGCDYTKLYTPLFLYTRYNHSLVVAHMTWHFTHDKKETIIALLHDVGTPCFAHCIDYVFGDYIEQESSEIDINDIIRKDNELMKLLSDDGIKLEELNDFKNYHILENKSPKLCTDRLDGVLHTCYVWIHTHSLEDIKEVYNNMVVLENEDKVMEIGFKDIKIAEKFVDMVYNYAIELQGNRDKFVSKFVSDIVKLSFKKNMLKLEDLYIKKEQELCDMFSDNFTSWKIFNDTSNLIGSDVVPENNYYISYDTKKRNTIPLVETIDGNKRIIDVSSVAKDKYDNLNLYKDFKYAYIEELKELD